MLGFLNPFRSKSAKPGRGRRATRLQSLTAKPLRLADGKLEETEDGGAKLRVKLAKTGAASKFFRFPEGATKTFELDELGLLVWNQCDGKTSVQQIIRRLAKKYDLNLREAEVSTSSFLNTLIKKGLIGVSVDEPTKS